MGEQPWWREAVVYQVYVRSFGDSGYAGGLAEPGLGDLPGITARLPHLRDLGVDAAWLTPFYPSPQHDAGYDVADYRDVDPRFGTLADADALLARAHELGLKVIVDLVPNHTSWDHAWFRAAVQAPPGSPERGRYLFREGRGAADDLGGTEPPNNWLSVFGGPAWTRLTDGPHPGQWYLHLFDRSQPDLDWRNPEVGDMFAEVLEWWLDRGADGFRVDVAHGLVKEASLRDQIRGDGPAKASAAGPDAPSTPTASTPGSMVERTLADEPMWDQPEVHDVYRRWRRIVDAHPGDRMLVAEAWTQTPESMARFVRPDEMQQSFNFAWLLAPWSAAAFADVVTGTFAALDPVGATPTWVLSNHDVVRHATRYGGGPVGVARARAATLTMLGLPGSSYVYQGEELGLEQVDVPPGDRRDPTWLRHVDEPEPPADIGRDGCRVPIPWSGDDPPYGFGPDPEAGQPWLPQPDDWAPLTVAAQTGADGSTLEFYRAALALRRLLVPGLPAAVTVRQEADLLVIERGSLTIALNCGTGPVARPAGEVLLSSGGPTGRAAGDDLPPDTAMWIRS